jgi:hypothetical protein
MAITLTALGPTATPEYIGAKKGERYTLAPATPSAPTAGAGAGTGPTITLAAGSSDYSGQVSVLTGSAPSAGGIVFTFNLANLLDSANYRVNVTPGNNAAQALAVANQPTPNQTAFTTNNWTFIETGAGVLAAATTYLWNYDLDDATCSVVITPASLRIIDAVEAYGPVLDRIITPGTPYTVQTKMRPHNVTAEVLILGK